MEELGKLDVFMETVLPWLPMHPSVTITSRDIAMTYPNVPLMSITEWLLMFQGNKKIMFLKGNPNKPFNLSFPTFLGGTRMSWKRGAYPEFTLEDVVTVLFMLREPVGRKTISEVLELGEGSVRTLLKKLSQLGAIRSTQRGHSLSERGKELLRIIEESFSGVINVGKVDGMPAFALKVRKPGEFKSIEMRDEAIRFHAKGAMILLVKNRKIVFPEDERPLEDTMPELEGKLKLLQPNEGDMIVVTWAESPSRAMKSAYHVALSLKGEDLPEELTMG